MTTNDRNIALDYLNGKIKKVLGVGIPSLDEQYVLKRSEWTLVGGHPSSGKSTMELYGMLLHSVRYGTRWACLMLENDIWTNIAQLAMWLLGSNQDNIKLFVKDLDKERALDFIAHHFKFFDITKTWNAYDALEEAEHLITNDGYDGFFLDPYNGLTIKRGSGLNSHEYDYEIAAEFRAFTKRLKCYFITTAHPQTEAQRATHKDGDMFLHYSLTHQHIRPPNKTDFEGGAKWANRADNIKIWHRYDNHPQLWHINILRVRKIKLTMTGGRHTRQDDDTILFEAASSMSRFFIKGDDCMTLAQKSKSEPVEEIPVDDFGIDDSVPF